MEINVAGRLFNLSSSYQDWKIENKKQKFSKSKILLDKFSALRSNELNKLPYRLNLLDDLSTNENAHSKFLIRLLQHQPTLLNFIAFVNDSNECFNFNLELIDRPNLTWEKMRIDGLIKETNKYAIIIENKIHNAIEQKHQVGRYIEKCKSIGFKVEQIYILYLTKTEKDSQSLQSWGENYKLGDFKARYSKLSYKSGILPWLEGYLKSISSNEELVRSAVVQYVDHLKHFFNKKEIYKKMNLELQKFLSKELDFKADKAGNIDVVINKIDELTELTVQLKALAKSSKYELFEEWRNKIIKLNYFEESDVFFYEDSTYIKTGIKLHFKEQPFSILVEHNSNSTYFGFGRHSSSDNLNEEIRDFLKNIIDEESMKLGEPWWYGLKHTNFSDGFADFEMLLDKIVTKLKITK
jgi:hypothetical protein